MLKIIAGSDVDGIDAPTGEPLTNRRFVELVRARLDADGHHDIAIDRQWIDEDEPGYPFLLNVPVGSEFVVPLKPRDAFFRSGSPAYFDDNVKHFATALVTLRRAERMLLKYARDMRRAAAKAIADCRAEGLDILLAGVGFKPTYAWHLTCDSWKESANHILTVVRVRHTSHFLRPTTSEVIVEETGHVVRELQDTIEEQRVRQARLSELSAAGADLMIDGITLDLLLAHEPDVEQVLRELCKKQHVSVPVHYDGYDTTLSLTTSDGFVHSGMQFAEAYWNGECIWLLGDNIEDGLDLVGRTLAGKVSHPMLACRKVARIERHPPHEGIRDIYHLDKAETFLFDADTGRIWPADQRLAA